MGSSGGSGRIDHHWSERYVGWFAELPSLDCNVLVHGKLALVQVCRTEHAMTNDWRLEHIHLARRLISAKADLAQRDGLGLMAASAAVRSFAFAP